MRVLVCGLLVAAWCVGQGSDEDYQRMNRVAKECNGNVTSRELLRHDARTHDGREQSSRTQEFRHQLAACAVVQNAIPNLKRWVASPESSPTPAMRGAPSSFARLRAKPFA